MKGTEHFKQTIKAYLNNRASADELFAVSYAKEQNILDKCITFTFNQIKLCQVAVVVFFKSPMETKNIL